jgi:signal transduction histidine kinase
VGFDPEAVLAAGRSSGLPGMQERVLLLGGRLAVESSPGGGTNLLAELPLGGHPGGKIDEHFHRLGR